MATIQWTNPSVRQFAGDADPTAMIVKRTRSLILNHIDSGWQGPPFDVFELAKRLGFSIIPNEEVLDARLMSPDDQIVIEYNPNRALSRIRFSIAHEIAHTFFSDFKNSIRSRNGDFYRPDEWQLELLCNIAASEILMPVGLNVDQERIEVTVEKAMEIRDRFSVSMEAALLRLGKLTNKPITIFSAARETDDKQADFRIDYVINSPQSTISLEPGMKVSSGSLLSECTAIGFTAKRREKWSDALPEFDVQCVGVPPYPHHIYPRVLGIIKTAKKHPSEPLSIQYVIGDATQPRGKGRKILAHIVNDSSRNWGKGFGLVVSNKFPAVSRDFHKWIDEDNQNLKLGSSHLSVISDDIGIFHMVAQKGFGNSARPRIRYESLARCLESLAEVAHDLSASVHMPRIGTGFAGGKWPVIEEMVNDTLIKRGVEVTVYDLPGRERPGRTNTLADFGNTLDYW